MARYKLVIQTRDERIQAKLISVGKVECYLRLDAPQVSSKIVNRLRLECEMLRCPSFDQTRCQGLSIGSV